MIWKKYENITSSQTKTTSQLCRKFRLYHYIVNFVCHILDFFLIMATFRDDYQDIFGESGDKEVNDLEGFSREELDFNFNMEVEGYSETES